MNELKQMGLSAYEIAIYKTVLAYGKSSAKEIAEISKVPPTAVYPNVKLLVQKGLLQQIKGDIAYFEAIPPEIAVNGFMQKKVKQIEELKDSLIPKLSSLLHQKEFVRKKEPVLVSQGIGASHEIMKNFIKQAKKSLFIVGWRFRGSKHKNVYLMLNYLKKLVADRKDVRIIITSKEPEIQLVVKEYLKAGIKVRFLPINNFSIVISDCSQCKITLKSAELQDRINMQIDDPDLSIALNDYFLQIWKKAVPIGKNFFEKG